jgi:TPP-dependent pyruvate/acetoin dehydrogenase alpha subunit
MTTAKARAKEEAGNPEKMAELFGRTTGVSRGRGGSMHLLDVSKHFMGGYAIFVPAAMAGIGSGLPPLAARRRFGLHPPHPLPRG